MYTLPGHISHMVLKNESIDHNVKWKTYKRQNKKHTYTHAYIERTHFSNDLLSFDVVEG